MRTPNFIHTFETMRIIWRVVDSQTTYDEKLPDKRRSLLTCLLDKLYYPLVKWFVYKGEK